VTKRLARNTLRATIVMLVAACASTPPAHRRPESPVARAPSDAKAPAPGAGGRGGYYLDDGPGDNPPPDLDLLPDAVPKIEKLASGANRPYNVFGVDYVPDLSGAPYKQRGVGSWYGRKFHGQRTSSGEIYDMYAMTAAHPTLPIPCYALVTNLQNGKSVIVRVNDRGPFLHNRIMDLSYAAAVKLGYLSSGSGLIEVEMLRAEDIAAGRIPVTTNSLYVAAAARGAGGRRPASFESVQPRFGDSMAAPGAASTVAIAATQASVAVAPIAPAPVAEPSLPSSYADRGIPPDLIPDPQPAAKLPETATGAGFYLQLGAFRARSGADTFAAHVTREIDPTIASKVQVSDAHGLYRVRIGPYAERADADSAATSLRGAIARPVLILPDGALR
jgi:rare lipoprotein A